MLIHRPTGSWRLFSLLLSLSPAILLFLSANCSAEATLTVAEKTVVGNELRLIVETSKTNEPFWSHSATTSDVRGFLITVDLASAAPMEKRSHVYGPLWSVRQPRSQLSFSAGVNFTQADIDAALASPHCYFDEAGELVRFRDDLANHQILFDRLDLATAHWKQPASYKPIDNKAPPMSEDQAISPSGRYMLLYQGGVGKLYDLYTGQEKPDAWLIARFEESRRIPHFQNIRTFVTDDLNHLVVSPRAIWNDGLGTGQLHETFGFNGKTYSRADYFLCADRPEPALGLVPRKADEREFLREAPDAIFTIDHQLMLMHITDDRVRLYRRDGSVVYHTEAKLPTPWANGTLGTGHLEADGKLVFFTVDFKNMDSILGRHVLLNTWDYRHGTTHSDDVPIVDLLHQSWGAYVPTAPTIAVK